MREARLRPDYAYIYPPDLMRAEWEPAARVAERVLEWLLGRRDPDSPPLERVLSDEHFEFRGEAAAAPRPPGARTRREDRYRPHVGGKG